MHPLVAPGWRTNSGVLDAKAYPVGQREPGGLRFFVYRGKRSATRFECGQDFYFRHPGADVEQPDESPVNRVLHWQGGHGHRD
jgi:hypothetical protein